MPRAANGFADVPGSINACFQWPFCRACEFLAPSWRVQSRVTSKMMAKQKLSQGKTAKSDETACGGMKRGWATNAPKRANLLN